jgi:hypothetical protein
LIDPVNRHVVALGGHFQAVAYNKELIAPERVPDTWEGFLKAEFKDKKIATDVRSVMFAALVPTWGLEKNLGFCQKFNYEPDVNAALQRLRQQESQAGRYNPVIWFPEFPIGRQSPSPGAQHRSIAGALTAAGESGTRSIIDMERVAAPPSYRAVAPLGREDLQRLFGTDRPTRDLVANSDELFEALERGQGVYIIVYKGNQLEEIFFAGYSFD